MTRPRLRTLSNVFDIGVYRGHSQQPQVLDLNDDLLTPKLIDKSHAFGFVLLLLILLQIAIPMPSYGSAYSADALRVYAHSRVIKFDEFKCLDYILWKESRYNYLARNGNHYGIGQMRSVAYQSKDPFTQIDLTIKYIHHRYLSMCNAYNFHRKHGYF